MENLKTVNIKGKEYVEVNERIRYFRTSPEYTDWRLITELVSISEDSVLMKASVMDSEGIVRATGYARECRSDNFINGTSYVENCETSAWGRALGNLGIGITVSIASAEEVTNAIKNQPIHMVIDMLLATTQKNYNKKTRN